MILEPWQAIDLESWKFRYMSLVVAYFDSNRPEENLKRSWIWSAEKGTKSWWGICKRYLHKGARYMWLETILEPRFRFLIWRTRGFVWSWRSKNMFCGCQTSKKLFLGTQVCTNNWWTPPPSLPPSPATLRAPLFVGVLSSHWPYQGIVVCLFLLRYGQ